MVNFFGLVSSRRPLNTCRKLLNTVQIFWQLIHQMFNKIWKTENNILVYIYFIKYTLMFCNVKQVFRFLNNRFLQLLSSICSKYLIKRSSSYSNPLAI